MTTCIAVLNKEAVALATDGAVTLSCGYVDKVYRRSQKLFALRGDQPLAIMTYANAEYMGLPVATLIDLYSAHVGEKRYSTVRAYADDFCTFLKTLSVFGAARQRQVFASRYRDWLNRLKRKLLQASEAAPDGGPVISVRAVTELLAEDADGWTHELLGAEVPEDFFGSLREQWSAEVQEALRAVYSEQSWAARDEQLPLELLDQAIRVAVALVTRSYQGDFTAFVFTGFGEEELFPAYHALELGSIALDYLPTFSTNAGAVTFECGSLIAPFAQRDTADTFITGVSPRIEERLFAGLSSLVEEQLQRAFATVREHNSFLQEDVAEAIRSAVCDHTAAFIDETSAAIREEYSQPMLAAVSAMPRFDLAEFAEALVNITSVRLRSTTAAETVSGATDVAVITRGGGCQWVRRNRYDS